MKVKSILILFVAACAFGLPSCSMFEPDLENIYGPDRILNDPSFAEGLLLKAYKTLPMDYAMDEVATDDAVTNDKMSSLLSMATGRWSPLFNPVEKWKSSYNTIGYLNNFLSIVDSVKWSPSSERRDSLFRKRYKGEALALRAYYHFQVLVAHGGRDESGQISGIPYITTRLDAKNPETWMLSRPAYATTVEAIFKDLDEAYALLPIEYKDITGDDDYNRINGVRNINRVNGLVARAIKSRVALHASSPAFNNGEYNRDWATIAASESAFLINRIGKVAVLGTTLKDPIFYDANNDSRNADVLWRSDFVTNTYDWEAKIFPPSMYGNGLVNPTQNFVDVFGMKNGQPVSAQTSGYNPADPYVNRDPRLANYVVFNGGLLGTSTIYTFESPSNSDGLNSRTNSTRTGYYLKKLMRPDVNLNPASVQGQTHLRPLIRYTEIYLNYAEAANELWGADGDPNGNGYTARTVIAAIRKRAGITQSGTADAYVSTVPASGFRELIRNERRIELSFEGFRFWDIRRWGEPMDVNVRGMKVIKNSANLYDYSIIENIESRDYKPHMQYGPIPLDEILKFNGQIRQNMGWN